MATLTHLRVAERHREPGRKLTAARPGLLRRRVTVLAAGGVVAAAAGVAGCPAAAAVLLAGLDAVVVVVSLRAPQRIAVSASLLAAAGFISIRLASSPAAIEGGPFLGALAGPTLLDAGAWASALLGAGVLLATSALALWCAEALAASCLAAPVARPEPAGGGKQAPGNARAEWLLAEARRGHRLVTLGLVGVDAPAEYELEPGEREAAMGQLDEMLRAGLGNESLSEYGPWERLVVLPDVWAEDVREQAASLVRSARQRIHRPVRVALITFPLDGPGAAEPLQYLERALEVCRAGRSSVSVGRPRIRRMTPTDEIA